MSLTGPAPRAEVPFGVLVYARDDVATWKAFAPIDQVAAATTSVRRLLAYELAAGAVRMRPWRVQR